MPTQMIMMMQSGQLDLPNVARMHAILPRQIVRGTLSMIPWTFLENRDMPPTRAVDTDAGLCNVLEASGEVLRACWRLAG